jgi:peptide/nickel transport system substrate-binding protein
MLVATGLVALLPWPQAAAQERTFIFVTRQEPATLDPHIETNNPPKKIFEGIYEGLLDYDLATLDVKPHLAQSWSMSSDGLQYTFRLRPNVKFHDGTTMDAQAVKYSFERMKKIGLGFAFVLDPVKSVDVVDRLTVRITLSVVDPSFVYGIPLVYIVSPTALQKNERGNDLGRSWVSTNEAGTGPYRLDEWVKNQRFTFTRFADYWRGWNGPHIAKFIFLIVDESATHRQMIERGSAHLVDTIEFDDVDELKKNPRVQVLETESLRQFYMILNTTKRPMNDARVRRAVAAVFDGKTLASKILRGHASLPRGPIPSKMLGFDKSLPEPKQDLALAKRLLTEAGYPNGGFTLTYVYFAPYEWQRINGELMREAFRTMGVDMRIEGLPFTTLTQRMVNPDTRPDITAAAVAIPTPDPDSLLFPMFHSSSRLWALNGYKNEQMDRILSEARTTIDTKRRMELHARAQRLVVEDVPAIGLTILNDIKVAAADVRGYRFNPMRPAMANLYDLHFESR